MVKTQTRTTYDNNPDIENKDDLYKFNNQVDLIEKRYNYDVNADFTRIY
jgi:hypothetical protein